MRRRKGGPLHRWIGTAVTAGIFAAAATRAGEPVRQPCDCCKLVCIEAEILKAQHQRDFYKSVPKNTKMSAADYEAAEAQAADRAESDRARYLDGNATCNYYDPNLADPIEQRRMENTAGFTFQRSGGAITKWSYTLTTNPETCKVNDEAIKYAPKVAACEGLGAAQVEHEMKHVKDCEARPAGKRTRSVGETAADEVAGYDTEIFKLEELRIAVAAQCKQASCKQDKEAWDHAAEEMLLFVDDVLQRGGPKPPSKSPLSTKAGKGGMG